MVASSYLATVAPSGLQTRVLDFARPYLAPFHFDADGVPLNLASKAPLEKTHQLEKSVAQVAGNQVDWESVNPPVPAGGDRARRWQRFLTTIAQLGDSQLPALAALLIEPIAVDHPNATHLRVTRQGDLMTTIVDDSAAPPYTTAVLRDTNNAIRFVQVPEMRLASPTVTPQTGASPTGTSQTGTSPTNGAPAKRAEPSNRSTSQGEDNE